MRLFLLPTVSRKMLAFLKTDDEGSSTNDVQYRLAEKGGNYNTEIAQWDSEYMLMQTMMEMEKILI